MGKIYGNVFLWRGARSLLCSQGHKIPSHALLADEIFWVLCGNVFFDCITHSIFTSYGFQSCCFLSKKLFVDLQMIMILLRWDPFRPRTIWLHIAWWRIEHCQLNYNCKFSLRNWKSVESILFCVSYDHLEPDSSDPLCLWFFFFFGSLWDEHWASL